MLNYFSVMEKHVSLLRVPEKKTSFSLTLGGYEDADLTFLANVP
jgi:hypothetical protein